MTGLTADAAIVPPTVRNIAYYILACIDIL